MSPQEAEHSTAVGLVYDALSRLFEQGYHVRDQISLGELDEPEPDIVIVKGHRRDYRKEHPNTVELVVEVASTSLDYDRVIKASLYAAAGIPEYWVLDLKDRRLEVSRDPIPMPDQPFGYGYRSLTIYLPDDEVSPLAKPKAKIKIADLLP